MKLVATSFFGKFGFCRHYACKSYDSAGYYEHKVWNEELQEMDCGVGMT